MSAPTHPILTTAHIGRLLHSARKARGMSQAELASRVGISQPRLSALELHPASIRVDQLLALCAALGLELAVQEKTGAAAAPGARVEW